MAFLRSDSNCSVRDSRLSFMDGDGGLDAGMLASPERKTAHRRLSGGPLDFILRFSRIILRKWIFGAHLV